MLAPTWTWPATVPVAIIAVLLLFAPGASALALLGFRRWTALAAAPLATVTAVGVGGLLFGAVHLPWTPLTAALWAAAALGASWFVGRRRAPSARVPLTLLDAHRAGAVALTAIVLWVTFVKAAVKPGNFPQNPDMIYHLDLTRWFVEHASVSSLDVGLGAAGAPFYPAALHGLAATVAMITAAPPIIALTATQLAFLAFAWPLGLIALLDALGHGSARVAWLAALLALALPIFPFRLIGYGPLWPFDAGLMLVPVWLALLVAATHDEAGRPLEPWAAAAAIALLPGLVLLHAGVALTAMIPAYFLANLWAWTAPTLGRLRTPVRVLAALSLPALVALGTKAAPTAMVVVTEAEPDGLAKALADAQKLWSGGTQDQWNASAVTIGLIVLGLVASGVVNRARWLIPTLAVVVTLALGLASRGTDWARWLTWPWQNVVERLRAITGLVGIVAAASGLAWVTSLGGRRTRAATLASALVLCAWLAWTSTATASVTLGNYYKGAARIPWLTAAEADALRTISARLPDDAVVVANPWNGGTFLQVVGPETMLIPTEKSESDDITVVSRDLDKAATSAEVCAALGRHRAQYLIVGGDPAFAAEGKQYASFDRAATASGFEKVLTAGPYTLLKITACA